MHSTFQYQLRQKMNEVFALEPNDLGSKTVTMWYKRITSYLKNQPFYSIVPFSMVISVCMYLLFGHLLVKLVSLLQYGF